MGLKSIEGGITTVKLPTDVRLALKSKGWTILDAIKNGIAYKHPSSYEGEVYDHPAYKALLDRMIKMRNKLNKLEGD